MHESVCICIFWSYLPWRDQEASVSPLVPSPPVLVFHFEMGTMVDRRVQMGDTCLGNATFIPWHSTLMTELWGQLLCSPGAGPMSWAFLWSHIGSNCREVDGHVSHPVLSWGQKCHPLRVVTGPLLHSGSFSALDRKGPDQDSLCCKVASQSARERGALVNLGLTWSGLTV